MQKTKGKILIVDDNQEALIALEMYLSKHFTAILTERNPNLIPNILRNHDIDVIILDMNFSAGISSGNEGIFWLHEILKIDPHAVVIFITAYGDIKLAVKGIKEGAIDFVTKPWENEKLLATVESGFKLRRSKDEINRLKHKQVHLSESIDQFFNLYKGIAPAMERVYQTIDKVANTDANILITGENGTGKELVAREIHKQSKQDVFIGVDIASLPGSLLESELFGYTKGAFTDAKEDKPGRFELAAGGTLFLDEIGNIPVNLQSKILSALQKKEISKIGSSKSIPVNFRLISATNRPLAEMVEENDFREDLLYRINTIEIQLPPLRERKEDIPGLVDFFIEKFSKKYNKPQLKKSEPVMKKLLNYQWPGNIRELEHAIEKAVILSEAHTLKQSDFEFAFSNKYRNPAKRILSLEENEKILIREALQASNGNMSDTADRLGITRATLYRKVRKYEI